MSKGVNTLAFKLRNFLSNEDGAVTVDWVVLTAGIVGLAIAAFAVIETQTTQLSADVAATVENVDVTSTTPTGVVGG